MSRSPRYSLWLTPSNSPARQALKQLIIDLADQYSRNSFDPHITLQLGGSTAEEAAHVARQISRQLNQPPFVIKLVRLQDDDDYFQCITIAAKLSGTLKQLRNVASQITKQPATPYHPHLSLLYADKTATQRKEIIDNLSQTLAFPIQLKIDSLAVWDCSGNDVSRWHQITAFDLNANNKYQEPH